MTSSHPEERVTQTDIADYLSKWTDDPALTLALIANCGKQDAATNDLARMIDRELPAFLTLCKRLANSHSVLTA